MEDKLNKYKKNRYLLRLLQFREISSESGKALQYHTQFTKDLVKRLGLEFELQGHQGCVNCLQWAPNGKILASGSDDTNVILWDPFRHKKIDVIPTRHIGNIFSVKFLGTTGEIISTAAADCRVIVQCIHSSLRNHPIIECNCHRNRVKRLAVSPEEPSLFWSAAEDGLVIQYDVREQHDCGTQSKVMLDLSKYSEIKCIAVNPTKPHYIAIGANDCYIRMYDRRKLKPISITELNSRNSNDNRSPPSEPTDSNCVQFYAPGHLAKDNAYVNNFKLATTYVSFNSAGSEMLVNIGGEQIYLFDINNSRHINALKVPQTSVKRIKTELYKCCCHPEGSYSDNSSSSKIGLVEEKCLCFYMRRAFKCYRRRWMGDLYSAARDYLYVIQTWPDHKQAYVGLIRCFIGLKWADEASTWLDYYCKIHPDYVHANCMKDTIESLNDRINDKVDLDFMKKYEEHESDIRLDSQDYETRFIGHCNTTTDIKEANFLGSDGSFICAGSDEGIIFIWDRKTSSIVTALTGDVSIVNCIQPHPSACFIASSGIDPVVKLWSPGKEVDESKNPHLVKDINAVVEANQQRMAMDPFESMLVNMGFRPDGRFHDMPCRTC